MTEQKIDAGGPAYPSVAGRCGMIAAIRAELEFWRSGWQLIRLAWRMPIPVEFRVMLVAFLVCAIPEMLVNRLEEV